MLSEKEIKEIEERAAKLYPSEGGYTSAERTAYVKAATEERQRAKVEVIKEKIALLESITHGEDRYDTTIYVNGLGLQNTIDDLKQSLSSYKPIGV